MISGTSAKWPRAKAWDGGLGHQPAVGERAVVAVQRRPACRPGCARRSAAVASAATPALASGGDALGLLVGQGRRRDPAAAGLHDGLLVEALGALGVASSASVLIAAGALAEDGDVLRVAAEGRDVPLHPLQRRDLVHQAVVAERLAGLAALVSAGWAK